MTFVIGGFRGGGKKAMAPPPTWPRHAKGDTFPLHTYMQIKSALNFPKVWENDE